jgi:hypothetical protein
VCFWLVHQLYRLSLRSFLIMSYTVYVTETNVATVVFDTKEEAAEWMLEPDYDLCSSWECIETEFDLEENKDT